MGNKATELHRYKVEKDETKLQTKVGRIRDTNKGIFKDANKTKKESEM